MAERQNFRPDPSAADRAACARSRAPEDGFAGYSLRISSWMFEVF
jgi:hypothetical protein